MNLRRIALAALVFPAFSVSLPEPSDPLAARESFKPKLPSEGRVVMATTDLDKVDAAHWGQSDPGDVDSMVWLRHSDSDDANPLLIGWAEEELEPDNDWEKWVDAENQPLEPGSVAWCWDKGSGLGRTMPLYAFDKDLSSTAPTTPAGPFEEHEETGAFLFVTRHTPTESNVVEASAIRETARDLPEGLVLMGWTGAEPPSGWRWAKTREVLKKRYLYEKPNKKRPLLIGWLGRGIPSGGQWLPYSKKLKRFGWIHKKGASAPMMLHPRDMRKGRPSRYRDYKKSFRWIIQAGI